MSCQIKKNVVRSVVVAFLMFVVLWFGSSLPAWSQGSIMKRDSMATKWRPRHGIKNSRYVGPQTCAKCHANKTVTYRKSAMSRALELVADSQILKSHPRLTFQSGPYTYRVVRQGKHSIYSVSNGTNSISEPILYALGQGLAGQTYIFRHKGMLYESRVSFYTEIGDLDWTIGHPRSVPQSLGDAIGHPMDATEARDCFGCHATAAVDGSKLQLDQLIPGVSCEACHGPGEKHIAAIKSGDFAETYIFNPEKLSADELSQEFCGSCHRSGEDVISLPQLGGGINNVRFQPYRISTSRGHDPNNPRLSCISCHDPHEPLQRNAAFYDANCTVCHLINIDKPAIKGGAKVIQVAETDGERTARPCPVGRKLCVTCHMPKVELPGSHFKFTDHRIRTARPNEPYPK